MHFNRLRLVGFKSFVEPTDFSIDSGLTGVVGPNGCGKSNLVEALRWVMGENSYKNMRASGMDDVIFSGSATRPSRNAAEVALFLDNADRTAPAAFNDADELQVSRRIERESGSVYRINGKEARAKDVQLLFADQSTGARSPSMVGQGRIGELIQAKPQARRALLEEAAGIAGLHSRRHEAELRLRAAEQNLERLDDVTAELQSQIESLKRQARQATRFKNLSSEIRQAEAILLHLRWMDAKAQEGEAKAALATATSLVGDRAQAQMEAAKEQAISARRLPELRDAEAKAAAALQRLKIARTQIEEEAERLHARRRELERRVEQLDADIAREEQILADNAEVLARLADEEKTLNAANADAAENEQRSREVFEQAAAALEASEATLQQVTSERAEANAARSALERTKSDAASRRDVQEQKLASISGELESLAQAIAGLPDPAAKRTEAEAAETFIVECEAIATAAEEAVEAARAGEASLRPALEEARSEFNRLRTEADTLAKILNVEANDLFPPALERISVERGYEAALGAAFGSDLDAPLDPNAAAYWDMVGIDASDERLPQGARPLAEVVKAPEQLARRLAQTGIVSTEDGPRLQKLLRPGQRLISRDGAMWRWDGFTASADAPTAAAQRLAQKNRLSELEAEIAAASQKVEAAQEAVSNAGHRLAEAVAAEKTARDNLRQAREKASQARNVLAAAERAAGEKASRKAALDESRVRLTEMRDEAAAQFDAAAAALEQAPDISEVESRFEQATQTVAQDRAALAEARSAHDGLAREAQMRNNRLASIVRERESWSARAQNAQNHGSTLAERRKETSAELDKLSDAPDEIEERRRALMSQLSEVEKLRQAAADRLQAAENESRERDQAATAAITALSESREARARAEERLTAAGERRAEVEARIREALNCPPHAVLKLTGLEPDAAMPGAADIERKLERLKVERERLGAVNLRAEEEQRGLSERYETIVSEREDVVEAIKKMRLAIQSLNKEGRDRLLAAFDVVNEHFKKLFTHLFGGGTAELQLVESEDPLDAGLEILARPPGKRPQTITLLSGGEQALTATALIFAVFLTNPAPICVLDEVDAPLDDHNVERFCNLMDEMAATTNTRFVIITHNPITMARMNRLFGVTMAEQGVSQLVSVDLQTAERLREAS